MAENSISSHDNYNQLVHDLGLEAEAIVFDPDHFEGGVVESGLRYMQSATRTSEPIPVPGSAVLIGGDRGRHESKSKGTLDYYELPDSAIPMPAPSVSLMKARGGRPHDLEERHKITVRDPLPKPSSSLYRKDVRVLEIHDRQAKLKIIVEKDDEGAYAEATRVHNRERRPATLEEVQIAFDGLKGFVESHKALRKWEEGHKPQFEAAASAAQAEVRNRLGSKAKTMLGRSSHVSREARVAGDAARRQAYHEKYNTYMQGLDQDA